MKRTQYISKKRQPSYNNNNHKVSQQPQSQQQLPSVINLISSKDQTKKIRNPMAFNEDSSASGHDEPWIQWYVGGKTPLGSVFSLLYSF